MNLAKLIGTAAQIEKAEKRRANYIGLWQKHLYKVKKEDPTVEHIQLIQSTIDYLSDKESALYWLELPTGNVMMPRNEMVDVDMNLYGISLDVHHHWLEMHGVKVNFNE